MNIKGLIKRGITAVFFVAVMVGGLYGGKYSFIALFAIITVLCLWEFFSLVLDDKTPMALPRKILGVVLGLTPFAWMSVLELGITKSPIEFVFYSSILFSPFFFLVFIVELFAKAKSPFYNIAFLFLGILYIGMPFALCGVIAFEGDLFYANTIFGILLLNWLNDTGAYFIGSMIGRTKLFPRISPNKTWEGTIGGVILTLITAYLLSIFFKEQNLTQWFILALIVSVFGTIGDLVESMLKRSFAIKDTGGLLPGHGGFLDRFDAFIFAIPFATAYLLWLR